MTMFVASRLYKASRSGRFNRGRWSPDYFIFLYYDEHTGLDRLLCPPTPRWPGSLKHLVHWSAPGGILGRRFKFCFCNECMFSRFWQCKSQGAGGKLWYGGVGSCNYKKVVPSKPKPKKMTLRNPAVDPTKAALQLNAMKHVGRGLGEHTAKKMVVVLRVAEEDRLAHPEEPYYLAKPTRKPWKPDVSGEVGGVEYEAGSNVFECQYFHFEGEDEVTHERTYTLMDGPGSAVLMSVEGVVSNVGDIEFQNVSRNDSLVEEYVLGSEMHAALCTKGDLQST